MQRLVLIDGKSVFYRGYYAMGALSLPDGTPTGGVYGFAAIAMEIVNKLQPTKVVVAWDSKTSTSKRRALYPEYKAGRVKPGEDFYAQIPLLKKLISALGWTFVEVEDYEADDIIGTFSRQADETFDQTGNCDFETFIISSDLDMLQIVDENTRMWRILKGFTHIEEFDVAEVEKKYGIKKSQFLDLKALKGDSSDNIPGVPGVGEKTAAKLLTAYETLDGIYAHLDQISGSLHQKLAAGKDSAYLSRQLAEIMFDAPVSLKDIPDFVFDQDRILAGLKQLEFNSLIKKFTNLSSDNSANHPSTNHHTDHPKPKTQNSQIPNNLLISWDVKALMHSDPAIALEIEQGRPFWDLSQAAFLLDPLSRSMPTLVDLNELYLEQRRAFEKLPKLFHVLTTLDLPLIPVLYKMEKHGMLIDRAYFTNLKNEYIAEVSRLESVICDLAGRRFNVNSPIQLSEVLFHELSLPTKGIKKTTRGFSTGAKELEKLKDAHPLIPQLQAYREAAKLLSTYIIPMPDLADANDRIHTTFTQNVTATGRLSSKDPNLQNIPVRTKEGKRIRAGFIAPENYVLVSADYSQFELRLAAVLSGDETLIADFNQDIDIHTKTAAETFNVPVEKVTKAQRRAAKVINFGILYGMSAKGLSDATGMSVFEAKTFIDNYFNLRAPIKQKLNEILHQAKTQGYVETLFGRRRPTPDVNSPNFLVRQAAIRAAENMPIQGTEADLMKLAMLKVSEQLPKDAHLIMQVHDSLIVECPASLAASVSKILKTAMESVAPELPVRLAVEVTTGSNWGEL